MERKAYDYTRCAEIWKRVAPEERPYPQAAIAAPPPELPGDVCRALLRQELRHTAEILLLLEKNLASPL